MRNLVELFEVIGELARRRYRTAERCYSAIGLTHTEARLLRLLQEAQGAAAQDTLSNGLTVDRTNAGRALQRLAQEGFVERRKDDRDKRANVVRMTPKGKEVVAEIGRIRRKIAATFFGQLTDEEAAAMVELLRKRLPGSEGGGGGSTRR